MNNLTLTQLIDLLIKYKQEIGCDGNPGLDYSLELEHVQLDLLPGCACPAGLIFMLKAKAD